ncbi:hypothetical protein FBT96_17235 [Rhodobacter capsulatus]|uniref:Uncharacterized protein n=1 Tax=Rhodobacter capsulatus TaxID=1061 RepID=A0A4U1JMC4_RHOCA|nr:hypothetical protein [Rhodobacter capsulatus]TKD15366.1 hypothetical protein FBT96_17235 [Rhodobacter capsulatus]
MAEGLGLGRMHLSQIAARLKGLGLIARPPRATAGRNRGEIGAAHPRRALALTVVAAFDREVFARG